ncbi:chemotaxis protein [Metarhizobium album]|uniref:Chemotaxis protein n=2 Tax=Metarhizobium album TaxID=2182425 RepID=A0A2U2DHW5_9HYPH|nr:chemotaxis protein [Rhizobium album]
MEAVSGLTQTLDSITGFFSPQATRTVVDGMTQAVDELAGLPAAADTKQDAFTTIAALCDSVHKNVDEMREVIRHLRTIAVTVKITGAGIPEFSGFADEIRERIQRVSEEVDRFARELVAMRDRLSEATQSSESVIRDFSATIPLLVANLDRGSVALSDQQTRMTETANELKDIIGSIQMKLATILSALQIGDITRQRIEHIITLLTYYEEFKTSEQIGSIDVVQVLHLEKAIVGLVRAQLEESVVEFHQQCGTIAGTIASFSADTSRVMTLRDKLAGSHNRAEDNVLRQMQGDLAQAADLSNQVLTRTRDLDTVASTVEESTQSLIAGIAAIRRIKLDIFYMALNSNLACNKLGEAGRAVNVVSGELRTFADRLEGPAEGIILAMQDIDAAKLKLTSICMISADGGSHPLDVARREVDTAANEMSAGLVALSGEGEVVFACIAEAIRRLDFRSDLGDVLDDCLAVAGSGDVMPSTPIDAGIAAIEQLSARIFQIYTMTQEREIHRRFLSVSQTTPLVTFPGTDVEDDEMLGVFL